MASLGLVVESGWRGVRSWDFASPSFGWLWLRRLNLLLLCKKSSIGVNLGWVDWGLGYWLIVFLIVLYIVYYAIILINIIYIYICVQYSIWYLNMYIYGFVNWWKGMFFLTISWFSSGWANPRWRLKTLKESHEARRWGRSYLQQSPSNCISDRRPGGVILAQNLCLSIFFHK